MADGIDPMAKRREARAAPLDTFELIVAEWLELQRKLGYSGDEQTAHSFRSMASTLLNEQGFPPDVIELQLAHVERNKVRAAYNRVQRLAELRKMMQE